MPAYYVEYHMRKALAPLLFDDEELADQRGKRDPVKPEQPSVSAKKKKVARQRSGGLAIHSVQTLLAELATRCRNRCRMNSDPSAPRFYQITEPTPLQEKAFQLLGLNPGEGKL